MYVKLLFSSVSQPSLEVTLSRTGPLYAGTELTLICTVTLDPNVDTNPGIMGRWSYGGSSNETIQERVSVTGNSSAGYFAISPLVEGDSGTHSCTVAVRGQENVLQSASVTENITITVMGEYTLQLYICSLQISISP